MMDEHKPDPDQEETETCEPTIWIDDKPTSGLLEDWP